MQAQRSDTAGTYRAWHVSRAVALFTAFCVSFAALPAAAQTLDRVRSAGRIKLGYLPDASPLSSRSTAGAAEGYGVALCKQVIDRLKTQPGLAQLTVDWVPVTVDNRYREVQQGNIDLLCTPSSVTAGRRKDVAFSIPVFAGGIRAVMRTDTATALRAALAENPTQKPVWRGSPAAKVLGNPKFAVVTGTTSATWLESRRTELQVDARIVPVPDYKTGVLQLLNRDVDAFFGDRALVLGVLDESAREDVAIGDRLFTHEPAAFALARGDDDFRLAVDTALSQIYASDALRQTYMQSFGEFDQNTRLFFEWNTLPQ
jgi:polar amino acid transport system substrate-binding protein